MQPSSYHWARFGPRAPFAPPRPAHGPIHGQNVSDCKKGCPRFPKNTLISLRLRCCSPPTVANVTPLKFDSHSIVQNYLQFVPVSCSLLQFAPFAFSLKKCRESMGSNLGHGSQGGVGQFRGSHGVMKTTSGNRWLQMCYKPKEGRCGWGVYASPPSPGAWEPRP